MKTFRFRSTVLNNCILLLNNTFLLLLSCDLILREQSSTYYRINAGNMSYSVVYFIPDVFLRRYVINWYVVTRLLQGS